MKENYVLITGATGGLGNAFCRQFANFDTKRKRIKVKN